MVYGLEFGDWSVELLSLGLRVVGLSSKV